MNHPPYLCNLCSYYSNDKNLLIEHTKGHKGNTPYECKVCKLSFTLKANCERHIKSIHKKQTREEIKACMSYKDHEDMKIIGQYPCRLCEKIFTNLRKLKSHNIIHMNDAPYRCNLCTYYSNDKNVLKGHMKGHKGDTPYECKVCELAFISKGNCVRHIKTIHGKQMMKEIEECVLYNALEDDGDLSQE